MPVNRTFVFTRGESSFGSAVRSCFVALKWVNLYACIKAMMLTVMINVIRSQYSFLIIIVDFLIAENDLVP
jgi:hypothetical protein